MEDLWLPPPLRPRGWLLLQVGGGAGGGGEEGGEWGRGAQERAKARRCVGVVRWGRGSGSCVGVMGWGRGSGSWVVGRGLGGKCRLLASDSLPCRGVAAPRGALALRSLVGWPGPWHRAPAPSLLPAPPQSRPLEPWAEPQGHRALRPGQA